MRQVIGVDLGGTQIRVASARMDGTIVRRLARLTYASDGPDRVLDRIRALVRTAAANGAARAIGVGVPGPTDPYHGVLLMGPNLPGWNNVNLVHELSVVSGAPVFVGNDANLAALAEHRYGAGRGTAHMVYITVSTGIGAGVIINGELLLGRQGLAGELGHMTIDLQSDAPEYGLVGTLEGLASGPNFAQRARIALKEGAQSIAVDMAGGDVNAVTPAVLSRAAAAGDEFARECYRNVGTMLGVGIVNILHTFNPQRIVIGGGVWLHCRRILEPPMWAVIRELAKAPAYWDSLDIVTAALGEEVGLLGAVALAVDGLRKSESEETSVNRTQE
jgi:glucokinase